MNYYSTTIHSYLERITNPSASWLAVSSKNLALVFPQSKIYAFSGDHSQRKWRASGSSVWPGTSMSIGNIASAETAPGVLPTYETLPQATAIRNQKADLSVLAVGTSDWLETPLPTTPPLSTLDNGARPETAQPANFTSAFATPTSLPAALAPLSAAPSAPVQVAAEPVAGGSASESTEMTYNDWSAAWRAQALTMPCGSCTGRACSVCSIRTGGAPAVGALPSGYALRVLQYFNPGDANASGTEGSVGAFALDTTTTTRTNPQEADAGSAPTTSFASLALPAAAASTNPIVLENMKQGNPESEWLIGAGDPSIEGFAAQFTIDNGNTVDFKINTDSRNYRIDIYRLGYYNGDGARKVATINRNLATAQVQPIPIFDSTRKLVDAGNWAVSASWAIPADAVSGVYIAKMTRLDAQGGENIIPFIVRDDENASDITFQTSDTTWQAYNWWGGYNLYGGIDEAGRGGRASAVSYNRPIITRDGGFSAGPQDYIFGVEYPTIRWLEQNGYDVNYISGIDTDRSAGQLLNSKVFLSVGHDEYWSAGQRDNVEAARDAGVNLAFLSGNEVYWETRWESSIDGSGTPYKTLVSYKERWENENVDVIGTTSTWRDPELGSGEPENALTGTIFTVDAYRLDTIKIPYNLSNFRFWSNTAVADIQPGQVYSLTPNLLGYEWDSDLDNGHRPDGLVALSSTTVDVNQLLLDYGNTTGPGSASHSLTLYRAPSGALVFGAGTVYWSWGLDSHHDNETTPTDPNVQQAMVNLFADMGVQPSTLMGSLAVASQSTDATKPTTTITSPTANGQYTAAQPMVITGTATDAGGGLVAVVEVSTDGGQTWHRASGFQNWTYTWTPLAGGTYNIKSRAVDDSVNLEIPGAGTTISVAAAATASLFQTSNTPAVTSDSDTNFVNLGVKFTSSQAGTIVGLRYYKGLGDGGTHVGSLWSSTGTLLRQATFSGETASGWQTVTFDSPVSITAGTTYVASYHSNGHYAATPGYFTTPHTNGPLTAQVNAGVYTYSNNSAFPTSVSNGSNYWVDVIYSGANTANAPPSGVNDNGFAVTRNTPITFAAATLLANDTDPNGDILSISGVGAASNGTVTFNSQANTITFTPTTGYTGAASFGYAISDGRGGTGSAIVNMTVSPPVSGVSLFSSSDTPAVLSDPDAAQVNLGVKFVASSSGVITGLKYYKGSGDTGTHTGSLWTSTGALLASATYINETASGWQTVVFNNPVSITAGTTYVASYHSNGHYAATSNYFTTAHVNGPLTAPSSSASGGNGVYTYGSGNVFPTSSYNGGNYWVDVLFSAGTASNQPPVAANDSGFSTQQNTALQLAASALLANDTDPDGNALAVTGVSGATNGIVSFNNQTNIISFTPTSGYTGPAAFSYAISDGQGGNALASVALTVTAPAARTTLFAANATPAIITDNDASSVELGMKFSSSTAGTITGLRFYKGPQNTGTHTGSLWTATGTLLATTTFNNETASGWQTASFASPVSISAGTTYVVSYHSNGRYSANSNYFTAPVTNGPLTAPSSAASGGNGLYAYGTASAFPTSSYNSSNYWVDPIFNGQLVA